MKFTAFIFFLLTQFCQADYFSTDDTILLSSADKVTMACFRDPSSIPCLNSLITEKDFLLAGDPDCKMSKTPFQNFFCLCKKARFSYQYSDALENCKNALKYEPADENVHLEMAIIYLQTKNYLKAIESARTALSSAPGMNNAIYIMAMSLEKSGDLSGALKKTIEFERLIRPDSPASKKKKDILAKKKAYLSEKISNHNVKAKEKLSLSCRKEYFNIPSSDLEKLYEKAKQCISYGEKQSQFLISHAKVCIKLGKYEEARDTVELIKKRSKSNIDQVESLMLSADLYLKEGKEYDAIKELDKAFDMGMNDHYWLEKYSMLAEQNGDYLKALKAMEAINEKDDLVKDRIEHLKDRALPDEVVLRELITRQVLPEGSSFFSPFEKKLFLSMRAAERNGATEYIRKKYMGFAGLVLETPNGCEFSRKLTIKGFNLYMRDISQKAVRFFEKKGIPLNEVFKLRTLSGDNYFDKTGRLTNEGFAAYLESLSNESKKNWLRINENVSTAMSPEKTRHDEISQQFISKGYMEISDGEYIWLAKETECPDNVLLSPPCNIKTIKDNGITRYFLCHKENICTKESLVLSTYIEQYRNDGGRKLSERQTSSGFFGSPSIKRKFCYKGRIWNGID